MNDKHQSRNSGLSAVIAGLAAAMGLQDAPEVGYLDNWGRGLKYRTGPLVTPKCDPSQHNTLRRDQVERRRKLARKGATTHKRRRHEVV